jgi:polyhydroxyalkanoate synthesis regulator phasin
VTGSGRGNTIFPGVGRAREFDEWTEQRRDAMMFETMKRAMLVGLGIQEKMKEFVDDLVQKGEVSKEESGSLLKDLMSTAEKNVEGLDKTWREMIQSTMERMNLPTREDIENLEKKVNALNRRVAKLDKSEAEK